MRSSRSFRALSVLAVALAGVVLVAGISPGATRFLTKKKALKLFYTKAKADARFLNVGEVEELKVEGWHEVGTAGQPPFATFAGGMPVWNHFSPPLHNTVAFLKDPLGVVHLKGVAGCIHPAACEAGDEIYTLPAGHHPAAQEAFPALTSEGGGLARVDVTSTGVVVLRSPAISPGGWVTLDGITFRAAS